MRKRKGGGEGIGEHTSQEEIFNFLLLSWDVLPILCHLVERDGIVFVHLQCSFEVLARGCIEVVHLLRIHHLLAPGGVVLEVRLCKQHQRLGVAQQ